MKIIERTRKTTGAGDLVEYLVKPIAKTLDKTLGTNLADCEGCEKRKENWNAAVPDIRKPLTRRKP
jgi:hypothetical protein